MQWKHLTERSETRSHFVSSLMCSHFSLTEAKRPDNGAEAMETLNSINNLSERSHFDERSAPKVFPLHIEPFQRYFVTIKTKDKTKEMNRAGAG